MTQRFTDPLLHSFKCAQDPVYWAETVLGIVLDDWQKDVITTGHRYICLLCSRQAGKTTVAAVKAAHMAIFQEGSSIVIVTPSMDQTITVFNAVKQCIDAARAEVNFDLEEDNKKSMKLPNGSKIKCVVANEGNSRGHAKVSLLIEDEAGWVPDEVNDAIVPMLTISNGQLMLLSTANGQQGHFYKAATGPTDWFRRTIPWQKCSRIPKERVDRYRAEKGDMKTRQEYECEFLSQDSAVFAADWIRDAAVDRAPFAF